MSPHVLACIVLPALLPHGPEPSPDPARAPDVSSYAAIDEALTSEVILPLGVTWRYFVGVAEPSPELEWTELDFVPFRFREGPIHWSEGASPFGFGEGEFGTNLEEMRAEGITTLYLRHVLYLEDPSIYDSIELEIPVDDGYVFYLNGTEDRRLHAGNDVEVVPAFDANASSKRGIDIPPTPTSEITGALKAGDNILAIQVLNHEDGLDTFAVYPTIRATYTIEPVGERARFDELNALLGTEADAARRAYLEGRHHQRLGDFVQAAPHFLSAGKLDPTSPVPWTRLTECHRALGRAEGLATALRELIDAGAEAPALFDAWARVFLEDLDGSPAALPALFANATVPEQGFFADALFAGGELTEGRPLRIDCGALEPHDGDGIVWSRDRFSTNGVAGVREASDGSPNQPVRIADMSTDTLDPLYRIPLPRGAYYLQLFFADNDADEEQRFVDIFVDGARAETNHDTKESARFAVVVVDGFLDVDLVRSSPDSLLPRLAAFEVQAMTPDEMLEHAGTRAEADPDHSFSLVQLARAHEMLDDESSALAALERAEPLHDLRPEDRARLAALRDSFLPRITSYAAVDDILRRRSGETATIVEAVRNASDSEEALEIAAYLEGRVLEEEGRLDEAIGFYESIVFSESKSALPVMRMAACLRGSALPEEAEGIIRESLFDGMPYTDELLQLWIALHMSDLKTDPWELIADLEELGVSDIVVLPTSRAAAQEWQYLERQPPSTTWSRSSFNASSWDVGPGGIGSGRLPESAVRTLWNTNRMYARRSFELPGRLLYPHMLAYFNDAGDVYLNGTRAERISGTTKYLSLPFRASAFARGENVIGLYGINYRYSGYQDVGVVQPLTELYWVLARLEEHGAIRLHSGGDDLQTADGTTWYADRFFGHGVELSVDPDPSELEVAGTDDDDLYREQRYWRAYSEPDAWYRVPVPNGAYRVTLRFAEIDPEIEVGTARYDVSIEKTIVIEKLDVLEQAGFATALDATFETNVTDGWLDVDFTRENDDVAPALAAIALERQ